MKNKEYFTIINKNQINDYQYMTRNLGIAESVPSFYDSDWVVCYYKYHDNYVWYEGWDYLEQAELVDKFIIFNEKDFSLFANDKTISNIFCTVEDDAKYIKECPNDYMFSFNGDIDLKSSKTASSKIKPSYYKGEHDLISHFYDIMTPEELRGFLKGNIIKYIDRYQDKNGIEDLNKAREYNGRLIEFEKKLKGESNEFIQ